MFSETAGVRGNGTVGAAPTLLFHVGPIQERHNLRTGTITIGIKGCCGSAGRDTAGYSPLHHVGIIAVRNSGYTFGTRKDYPA